ncbi:MAG: exodeoxyribonuclease V subunit gamma [Candidatus Thiodiazotropha sp. (ex Monitilora ramsayi)]|nr:exodeoxyribonuclease V subunit gamma [Candidatus Thiodiazotropha sp. (ex Monitilora ramsayi)]
MLILHQSNRLERLSQRLSSLLSQPVGSPMTVETVVVQHPGMARWLSLEIADRLGICANLQFPLPAGFIWQIFHTLLPESPPLDRYQPDRLAWRIYHQLGQVEVSDLYRPVNEYLSDDDEVKRFQLAHQLALLYDRYLVYRPDWILAWQAGQPVLSGDEWQADLWRRLNQEEPTHWVRQQQVFFDLAGRIEAMDLPPRVFVFGVPTLSPGYLDIIHHVSTMTDVHLFLLNPCEAHWAEIVSEKTRTRMEASLREEQLYLEVGHPLLASMGRQGRDFFAAINELDPGSDSDYQPASGDTLLQRMQNQILWLEMPYEDAQCDGSIAFHLCHSPMREAEVLYDQLLAMFEEIPGLTPSDILVMTPDIDRYAPLIEAVFSEPGDRPGIPFRISDRSLQQTNPLATVFMQLLQLPGSRYGVGAVLSLLESPAVQRRFNLDQLALDELTEWLQMASIRWGRDGKSKSSLGLPEEERHTWQAGLRRLLLGYAMPGESDTTWHEILPLDCVEGGSAERLGGLLSFCDALFALEGELGRRPVSEWEAILLHLMDRFFLPDEENQLDADRLREMIHQISSVAGEAGFDGEVGLGLISYCLQDLLASSDSRGFLGGGVNFCSLAPMRSLPFRVVCLLGMNDGAFPRRQPELGFDLMNRDFRLGDRSRRVDDRYLFLETLISARDRLYISYVGRNQRDNAALPPSVVVDELRDTLRRVIGESGLDAITHHHPLQPFSPDYFSEKSGLFSFSRQRREAAMQVGQGSKGESPLQATPLRTGEAEAAVSLEALINFFINPPRAFIRERLQLSLEAAERLPDEREPFVLERFARLDLERWLVESLLQGRESEALFANLDAAGSLPHGEAGEADFRQMMSRALPMSERLSRLQGEKAPGVIDIEYEFEGVRLTGQLSGVNQRGLLAYSTERFYPYQMVRHWIRHLAINLASPEGFELTTQLLERGRNGSFRPVEDPRYHLHALVERYRRGHDMPLLFYPATSWAFVETLQRGGEEKAMARAQDKWFGNRGMPGDGSKPYNRLLWSDDSFFGPDFSATAVEILQPLIDHLEWS